MYETYIFDLDGTLLDTIQDLADSTNYALRQFGMKERSVEEVRGFVGNGVRLLIECAVEPGTRDCDIIKVFDSFRSHYLLHSVESTRPYPGIIELLAELKKSGKHIAIVSNKFQPAITDLNNKFFSQYIEVAIGERIGLARKPAPDMVHEAIRCLETDLRNAVYIGDSDVDILTANNCNIPCISVLWGFRDRSFLASHGATYFAEKPLDILKY